MAFKVSSDDLFFQPHDSEAWKRINEHLTVVEVLDPVKYEKQIKGFINVVCSGGAAFFEGLESENTIYNIMKNGAYYGVKDDIGILNYRYWLSTNKNDYAKVIALFNMPNRNKIVKEATKLLLDSIPINIKLYCPMLAKPFTLQESAEYDNLTDEKLNYLIQNPEILSI